MRTLVVEDDHASRLVLATFMQRHGEVFAASDGQAGLEVFRSHLEQGNKFDLVCLDIMMPRMDGQTALKRIREIESALNVPTKDRARVIMTTALSDKANLVRALPNCDAYLTKPIEQSALIFYLRQFGLVGNVQKSGRNDAPKEMYGEQGEIHWVD
jgi:two-component system chemotaxis response regulator CheY